MWHDAKSGAKRRWGMVDRFNDGLLTPAETASYLEIPQSTLTTWWSPTISATSPGSRATTSLPACG